jgi:8-oxo-dGTP pyrophosphatase MutT (NUDIX family)
VSHDAPLKNGVVAVLSDDAGRYLFIRRGLTLARSPGWWCFVGGQVEPGESLESAAAREMQEEVGLRVTVGDRIHESVSPNGEFRLFWFATTLRPTGQQAVPCPVEVEEIRWLSAADGLRLDPLLPGLRAWLEEKQKRIGPGRH